MSLSDVFNDEPTPPKAEPEIESKGEDSAPPAPKQEEPKSPEVVPLAALKAERDKRQELERQLKVLQEQKPKTEQEEDDFAIFENPKAVLERQRQELRLETSAMIARSKHEDFDEKAGIFFQEMAQQNPAVINAMLNAKDPADFIYREVKKHLDAKDLGDPEAYKAKLRQELEAQIRAEMQAPQKRIPPDLAAAPSAGGHATKASWDGPTPLRDILTRK